MRKKVFSALFALNLCFVICNVITYIYQRNYLINTEKARNKEDEIIRYKAWFYDQIRDAQKHNTASLVFETEHTKAVKNICPIMPALADQTKTALK
jgi:hypothetical protein